MRQSISEHEGKKYLRKIYPAVPGSAAPIEVDIYCVLKAFPTGSSAVDHALKKLMAPGQRGKGDFKADLIGVLAAVNRAIDQIEEEEIGNENRSNRETVEIKLPKAVHFATNVYYSITMEGGETVFGRFLDLVFNNGVCLLYIVTNTGTVSIRADAIEEVIQPTT